MELRRLKLEDEAAFFEALSQWPEEDREWLSWHWRPGVTFPEIVEKMDQESLGVGLPAHLVPATMFYGFQDGAIVGRLHLRHRLNEALTVRGGHIGYAVNPPSRGKGFATAMLKLGLRRAAELGIDRVMITCAESNVGSWIAIERAMKEFGGILESTFVDQKDGQKVRKYWVETRA